MIQRIRTIKPEFFRHEGLFDLEQETGLSIRLAFAGLWTCCDREGRFQWRPRVLKTMILPYDTLDFSRVLDALATRGFLVKYAVGGEEYGLIPSFMRHQVINNRESGSQLPAPGQEPLPLQPLQSVDACAMREACEDGPCVTPLVHAPVEGKGKEGKGTEQNHHASGALKDWLSIKAQLESELPAAEYKLWVRPMYLLKNMSGTLLLSLPPNNAIVQAARLRQRHLEALVRAAGWSGVAFTAYTDEYQRERLRTEYPEFYEQMFGNRSHTAPADGSNERSKTPARQVPASSSIDVSKTADQRASAI